MNFLTFLQNHHTPSTVKFYMREANLYLKFVNKRPGKIQKQDIVNYICHLRKRYENSSTIQTRLTIIKKYHYWLSMNSKRKDNPASYISINDKTPRDIQLQDLFSHEELERLISNIKKHQPFYRRNSIVMNFFIHQGLQTGEIAQLRLDDIDFKNKFVYVRKSAKTKARYLKLEKSQIEELKQYIAYDHPLLLKQGQPKARKSNNEILIINNAGNPETGTGITQLVSTFKPLFPGKKLNPKTIRQSVIANLLETGQNLCQVQNFAGHNYPSTTWHYKQNNVKQLKCLIDRFHPMR